MNLRKDHYHALAAVLLLIRRAAVLRHSHNPAVPAQADIANTTYITKPRALAPTNAPAIGKPGHAATRTQPQISTTFSNGYLGSCDDEERSEMRYVMRIAERESSNL